MNDTPLLTKQEHLRLMAFIQAAQTTFCISQSVEHGRPPTLDELCEHAKQIEAFLKAANPN
jgi:hypothetical protein